MDNGEIDLVALGAAIADRRKALGWKRYRLATRAGLADPYLGRVEAGDTKRLGVEVIAKIAKALGVTVDDLLADAGLPTGGPAASQMDALYQTLGPIERRALLRMGHTLADLQAEYAAMQGEAILDIPGEPKAAQGEPEPPAERDEPA